MSEYGDKLDTISKYCDEISQTAKKSASLCNSDLPEISYEFIPRMAELAEKTALLVRELVVCSKMDRTLYLNIEYPEEFMDIKVGFTREGWFVLDIPALLPKKGRRKSVEYIKASVAAAMMRYFFGKPQIKINDCVISFRHIYRSTMPVRKFRDHDNIEAKAITDVIASFLMDDDMPMRCFYFHCSEAGDVERTEIHVVPQAEFIDWTYAVIFSDFRGFELL